MYTKAVTFSFDDGVRQDERLIEILDRYQLKATFNINSARLGEQGTLTAHGRTIQYNRYDGCDIPHIYRNHEVAAHTLTHRNLTTLSDEEVIREVEEDRKNLSKLCGYEIFGMAYPCGGTNNNDHVASLIAKHTGIRYARTITSSNCFSLPSALYRLNPSVRQTDFKDAMVMAEHFISLKAYQPALFYIWGHSFDFDFFDGWEPFEEFCRLISGHKDIFYGTNREVLL